MKYTEERLENFRRMRFVRRVYAKNPLMCMQEITQKYPEYSESMLLEDLRVRSKPKPKKSKHKKTESWILNQIAYLVNQSISLNKIGDADNSIEYNKKASHLACRYYNSLGVKLIFTCPETKAKKAITIKNHHTKSDVLSFQKMVAESKNMPQFVETYETWLNNRHSFGS